MEESLSRSFDYLSSSSPTRIRKGLRQLEGILAQICLSKPAPSKRHSMLALGSAPMVSIKNLDDLKFDYDYRELFKLQQSFQWNIAMRLVSCLERLLGRESNGQNDLLVIQTLDLIHGVLLLHPPSRELFAREIYMNLFLDLLDPQNCPAIQSSTILALVTSLLGSPQNTRTFESVDGLLVVTSLYKARTTSFEIKEKIMEFLTFYLMPETKIASTSASNTAVLGGRGREIVAAFDAQKRRETVGGSEGEGRGHRITRTPGEKQALLARYLSNVEEIVSGTSDGEKLFGGSVAL